MRAHANTLSLSLSLSLSLFLSLCKRFVDIIVGGNNEKQQLIEGHRRQVSYSNELLPQHAVHQKQALHNESMHYDKKVYEYSNEEVQTDHGKTRGGKAARLAQIEESVMFQTNNLATEHQKFVKRRDKNLNLMVGDSRARGWEENTSHVGDGSSKAKAKKLLRLLRKLMRDTESNDGNGPPKSIITTRQPVSINPDHNDQGDNDAKTDIRKKELKDNDNKNNKNSKNDDNDNDNRDEDVDDDDIIRASGTKSKSLKERKHELAASTAAAKDDPKSKKKGSLIADFEKRKIHLEIAVGGLLSLYSGQEIKADGDNMVSWQTHNPHGETNYVLKIVQLPQGSWELSHGKSIANSEQKIRTKKNPEFSFSLDLDAFNPGFNCPVIVRVTGRHLELGVVFGSLSEMLTLKPQTRIFLLDESGIQDVLKQNKPTPAAGNKRRGGTPAEAGQGPRLIQVESTIQLQAQNISSKPKRRAWKLQDTEKVLNASEETYEKAISKGWFLFRKVEVENLQICVDMDTESIDKIRKHGVKGFCRGREMEYVEYVSRGIDQRRIHELYAGLYSSIRSGDNYHIADAVAACYEWLPERTFQSVQESLESQSEKTIIERQSSIKGKFRLFKIRVEDEDAPLEIFKTIKEMRNLEIIVDDRVRVKADAKQNNYYTFKLPEVDILDAHTSGDPLSFRLRETLTHFPCGSCNVAAEGLQSGLRQATSHNYSLINHCASSHRFPSNFSCTQTNTFDRVNLEISAELLGQILPAAQSNRLKRDVHPYRLVFEEVKEVDENSQL
eukprot:jgi/Bigna1/69433/fgenesh1_pg.9_\